MTTHRAFILSLLLSAFLVPAVATASDDDCADPAVRDSYACREVVLEYNPALLDLGALLSKYNLRLIGTIPELFQVWLEAPPLTDIPLLIDQLQGVPPGTGEPGVIEAERNGRAITPECRRWNADVLELGPDAYEMFRLQPARDVLGLSDRPLTGAGVIVAVLDTGVSRSHPAVRAALITPGIDLVSGSYFADDSFNTFDDDNDGETDRGYGHGTAVAGLIHLAAPNALILPVRVLDDECRGTAYAFAAGVIKAVHRGAHVLNLSFGSLDHSSVVTKAIRYARDRNVLVVAPAGNDGDSDLQFPADDSSVLAVAAIDNSKVAWAFSNHHSNVDLVAPGFNVIVPYRGSYIETGGTSFSTAFISGAAAAAIGADPSLAGRDLTRMLQDISIDVDPFNPTLRGELGKGVPWFPSILRLRSRSVPVLFRTPYETEVAVPPSKTTSF